MRADRRRWNSSRLSRGGARIEDVRAVPARPFLKRPRNELIVNHGEGFVHSSIPHAHGRLSSGRKNGAFSATVVDDLSILERPEHRPFDAVVMNNTTLRLPLLADADEARETRAQQRFLDFVRGGKGLVGVHAATDCLYTWPAYGELLGGYFDGHPWNEEVRVKLDDPGHPLLAAFKGLDFTSPTRLQFTQNTPRDSCASCSSGRAQDQHDQDKSSARMETCRRVDSRIRKGRVFYFSLGHRHENSGTLRPQIYSMACSKRWAICRRL
jgi:type 1 glutamine amidotransferase